MKCLTQCIAHKHSIFFCSPESYINYKICEPDVRRETSPKCYNKIENKVVTCVGKGNNYSSADFSILKPKIYVSHLDVRD